MQDKATAAKAGVIRFRDLSYRKAGHSCPAFLLLKCVVGLGQDCYNHFQMTQRRSSVRPLQRSDLANGCGLRTCLWDETPEDDHKDEMVDIIEHPDSSLLWSPILATDSLYGFSKPAFVHVRRIAKPKTSAISKAGLSSRISANRRRQQSGRNAEEWARAQGCTEMASDAEVGNDRQPSRHTPARVTRKHRGLCI